MKHPRLDTELGRKRKRLYIERSKERLLEQRKSLSIPAVVLGGDNFEFVDFGDVTELKLWERR